LVEAGCHPSAARLKSARRLAERPGCRWTTRPPAIRSLRITHEGHWAIREFPPLHWVTNCYVAQVAPTGTRPSQLGLEVVNRDPPCPRCKEPMRLTRTVPKIGPLYELQVFLCMRCGEVDTIEVSEPED
jgi:hypothetical protein